MTEDKKNHLGRPQRGDRPAPADGRKSVPAKPFSVLSCALMCRKSPHESGLRIFAPLLTAWTELRLIPLRADVLRRTKSKLPFADLPTIPLCAPVFQVMKRSCRAMASLVARPLGGKVAVRVLLQARTNRHTTTPYPDGWGVCIEGRI